VVGGFQERRHLRSLEEREARFKDIRVNNLKRIADPHTVGEAAMVLGQVVIATDYYKSFVTRLKNLIGGEMKTAMSLCTRARREALLRLLEQAQAMGAREVWNVRYGFSNIAGTAVGSAMQIELIAYGTAIVRKA
jgi:uncharacterized protein YbjQ (UPF0145 family)